MAGNTSNVSLWDEADVYVLFPEDIAAGNTIEDYFPANVNEEFVSPWIPAGLLNGGNGFEDSRDRDSTKHPAWGYGPILQSFKDPEYERTFTCLEDNPVTARLKSNNDTDDDVIASTHTPCFLAFETRDRRGKKRRRITRREADVTYDGGTENDSDLDEAEFKASIYPDDQKRVFKKQDENTLSSGLAVPFLVSVGAATAGTFTLTWKGETTAAIAYNATAAAVKAAVAALDDGYKASDWTVSGSTGGPWTVTAPTSGAITGAATGLTGGTFSVAAA